MPFGSLLHLGKHKGTNLTWRVFLAHGLYPSIAIASLDDFEREDLLIFLGSIIIVGSADQALGGENCVFGICDCLALGRNSHKPLAILGETNNGRSGAHALAVFDDLGRASLHDGHAGIRSAKIDSDDIALRLKPDSCSAKEAAILGLLQSSGSCTGNAKHA
mmetsp:Transcript_18423/g.32273  ORF Transcript_18423/g.32273 Transcript_18423/m.32273 type:complete len:162 (+) Transcript_18423:1554-2039(+)